jgi:hypothetical protein
MRTASKRSTRLLKAQSIAEYTVLVAVVITAIGAMSVFARRGLQGRYRDVTRAVAAQGPMQQFEPGGISSETNQRSSEMKHQDWLPGEVVENNGAGEVNTAGTQNIALDREQ